MKFFKEPLDQAKQDLQNSEKKLNALKVEHKNAMDREKHFIEILTTQLVSIYDNSKKLAPDAQEPDWLDSMKQYLLDGIKILKYTATAGGVGALASWVIGKGDIAAKIAVGAAIPAGLCALWSVKSAEEARDHARGFLIIVEDVKNHRTLIEQRMRDIAKRLALRFKYAIQKLTASEDGIERLASFFSTVIARDLPVPNVQGRLRATELDAERIVQIVTEIAIPQGSNDPLYSGWFTTHKLAVTDKKNSKMLDRWSVSGLLLKSPLCILTPEKKYYVREGKLGGDENRADKYPPQIVCQQLPRYLVADEKSLQAIRENPILVEMLQQAEQDYRLAKQSVENLKHKLGDIDPVPSLSPLSPENSVSLVECARSSAAEAKREEAIYNSLKRQQSFAFTPAILPTNVASLTDYARLSAKQVKQEEIMLEAMRQPSLPNRVG